MPNPIVIDVSHHQPDPIDWARVKAGGTVGVIFKATEGTSYEDPSYGTRMRAAHHAGLCTAAYHFLRPGNIQQQMTNFAAYACMPVGGRLVIDFEDPDCTFDELEEAAATLLGMHVYEVAVYGSNVLVEACDGNVSELLGKTSLWQARYSDQQPDVPDIWPIWSLWQYTDNAAVDGITGPVDGNKWHGHPARLPDWFQRPDRSERLVSLNMIMPPGIELRLTINGIEYET
jgi:lysozyme